jgi:hypothetical protein
MPVGVIPIHGSCREHLPNPKVRPHDDERPNPAATDEVANCVFPKIWLADRAQRARIIGEWLQTKARFLG